LQTWAAWINSRGLKNSWNLPIGPTYSVCKVYLATPPRRPQNIVPEASTFAVERPAKVYRFGPFELRLRTHELYKGSIKLKLRPQPFRVLAVLLARRGDVVTRDELHELLWKSGTFVDFEQGLNQAVKELRASLSDSADAPRYVETVPRVGYRIIVPVEILPVREPSEAHAERRAQPTEAAGPATEKALRRLWHSLPGTSVTGFVAILLLGAVVLWLWSHKRAAVQPPHGRVMLAVLPFENLTGDAGQEYFSDGLTEEMISQLGSLNPEDLGVIARTSVMHYKHTQTPLNQIGRELGVQYVLEGSVRRDANTVRVSAQLIQVKDQTHLWSREYDRQLSGLLAVQQEITQEIANEIELTLGDKRGGNSGSHAIAKPPASYEAYDLYLKGRFFWNKRTEAGFHQAADYFQQAIDRDPNYARAYAGLADTFALLSTYNAGPSSYFMPKARAAALKALQIDDGQAEAHASLALIAEQYDYDWHTAEREFRRAIQLDPAYATGHQWYAECLSFEGHFDEALAESRLALQLDPLSLIIATDHATILYYSGQYDRAIEQFHAAREMEPDFPRMAQIIYPYVAAGKFADALAEVEPLRSERQLDTRSFYAVEAYVYGRWGRHAEAQDAFAKFENEVKRHPLSESDFWMLLDAYMGMGRKDDVIATLEKLSAEHTNVLVALKVDPFYEPLRGQARFQELLRRANLAS
jgi:TolB-like protein/DNA-binding winged helix-turn-helix (wHTH) protein/Tfp pilus assembly protein PilF